MFSRQFINQQLQCNLHKHVIVMDKAAHSVQALSW